MKVVQAKVDVVNLQKSVRFIMHGTLKKKSCLLKSRCEQAQLTAVKNILWEMNMGSERNASMRILTCRDRLAWSTGFYSTSRKPCDRVKEQDEAITPPCHINAQILSLLSDKTSIFFFPDSCVRLHESELNMC